MENTRRLTILRIVVVLAFLAGLALSRELWFPIERTFPRAPLLWPLPVWGERLLTLIFAASLGAFAFAPRRRLASGLALAALALLIAGDQMRLQPWVYQYFLLLLVFALHDDAAAGRDDAAERTLALAQWLLASLYFWSGAQKLNYTFAHETLPLVLAPLRNLLPGFEPPFAPLGIAIALFEILIGLGLLWRPARNAAVAGAVATHLVVIGLLVARDANRIVWLWNAALIVLVAAACWRSRLPLAPARRSAGDWTGAAGTALVAAAVALPALSFFGLWDLSLSAALYSGNTEIAVIRTNESLLATLPAPARSVVIETKSGEKMLPLVEWALAEMNVPAYPARRVSRQTARALCRAADDRTRIELIVRERPAMFDGRYSVARFGCAELDE